MQFCSMFEKLRQHWKVNNLNLFLIISTFALGGSACASIAKKILGFCVIKNDVVLTIVYLLLITVLWPICVLIISIPLNQFSFFKKYLLRVFGKLSGKKKNP